MTAVRVIMVGAVGWGKDAGWQAGRQAGMGDHGMPSLLAGAMQCCRHGWDGYNCQSP